MNKKILIVLRISMGLIFLWAFLDKLFGLGFATTPARAWIAGGSPTAGFLSNSPYGPFAEFFQSLAGSLLVDWLFMLGLLFVGITFILSRWIRWGSIAGIAMMLLMYLAMIPPANNPVLDEHLIYALVLALFVNSKKA